jgi:hypothetical protein
MKEYTEVIKGVKELDNGKKVNITSKAVYNVLDDKISTGKIGKHLKTLKERKMIIKNDTNETKYHIIKKRWKGPIEDILEKAQANKTNYFEKSYIVEKPLIDFSRLV